MCRRSSDCPSGEKCRDKVCYPGSINVDKNLYRNSKNGIILECKRSKDCEKGKKCVNNVCRNGMF